MRLCVLSSQISPIMNLMRFMGATRVCHARADIWVIALIAIVLVVAMVLVILKLVDQTNAHVSKVSKTKVKLTRIEGPSLSEVEQQVASDVRHCPKKINYGGMELTRRCFKYIGKMKELSTLDAEDSNLKDEWLEYLAGLQLRKLLISGTEITDGGIIHLSKISTLQRLNLGRTKVTNVGIKNLLPLQNLIYLGLRGTRVTDDVIDSLKNFPNLQELDLRDCSVTWAAIARLKELPRLQIFSLGPIPLTPEQLRPLKEMKTLQNLRLDHCSLGEPGMSELATFTNVSELDVYEPSYTDRALMRFVRTKQLNALRLDGSIGLSPAALEAFKKARPDCKVKYKGEVAI